MKSDTGGLPPLGLVALLAWLSSPALGQITIGPEFQADARESGSGYVPGDPGYWIGSSPDGYAYSCWSEERPSGFGLGSLVPDAFWRPAVERFFTGGSVRGRDSLLSRGLRGR